MRVFWYGWKRPWDIPSILLLTSTTQDKASSGQSSTLTSIEDGKLTIHTKSLLSFLQEIQKKHVNPEYDKSASACHRHTPPVHSVWPSNQQVCGVQPHQSPGTEELFIQTHYDDSLICMLRQNRTDSYRLFTKSTLWPLNTSFGTTFLHKWWYMINHASSLSCIHNC